MFSRYVLPLALIVVTFCLSEYATAQTRTDLVCWANSEQVSGCPPEYRSIVYQCGTVGHSGFNPDWVCQNTCGTTRAPKCRIIGGPGGDGGQCGYRAARVDCYN